MRAEVTVSDTLRNFIKAIWQKQQDQKADKVGHLAGRVRKPANTDCKDAQEGSPFKSNVDTHEKYGRGNESIGYGQSGNVRLSRKTNLNSQTAECYAIKEYRRGTQEMRRTYRNRSTSKFCISSCLRHANVINILDLV
jgi:protein-serine/threonine kinase